MTDTRSSEIALKHVFGRHYATMAENLDGVLAATADPEPLHRFRVAVRRTRSLINRFRRVLPEARAFSGEVRWLSAATGPARDLDVCLIRWRDYVAFVPKLRDVLSPVAADIEHRREEAYCELAPILRAPRCEAFFARWRAFTQDEHVRSSSRLAGQPIAETGQAALDRTFRRVMRAGMRIRPESHPERLHALRKTCKKLRHVAELVPTLYGASRANKFIGELKRLQNVLGEFQDLEVHMEMLDLATHALSDAGERSAVSAANQLHRHMEDRKLVVRGRFDRAFRRFSKPKIEALSGSLFPPEDD